MNPVKCIVCLVAVCMAVLIHQSGFASQVPWTGIESGVCGDLQFIDIPVGDFKSPQMPEAEMRMTQKYNNSFEEGYCLAGGSYAPSGSAACDGYKIYYGHDGIDLHQSGAAAGANPVFATHDGVVVVSHKVGTRMGWGETIIVASRAGKYSQEILTQHYHHLYQKGADDTYTTSRRFNACDHVSAGNQLALEGKSGTGAVHLHYSVRRWNNIGELQDALKKNGRGIYGVGYSFGNDAKLKKHLDPQSVLYHTFRDFEDPAVAYSWALPDAVDFQQNGIEFGLWNGKFGAEEKVTRAEIARWLKISAELPDSGAVTSTFEDVPFTGKDCIYVEALTKWPEQLPVVNPYHSCESGARKFCPDDYVNRAEALKMVVLAFYSDEFFKLYDGSVWKKALASALELLTIFSDVDPFSWNAPYVFFGVRQGMVAGTGKFYPADPVTRAEVARWIVNGYTFRKFKLPSACDSLICGPDMYCDRSFDQCVPLSICVPSETMECEVGGGYVPEDAGAPAPAPDPDPIPNPQPQDAGSTCTDTYIAAAYEACNSNSAGAGNPTLCIYLQKLSGSSFQYRVCKQGSVFANPFTYQLKDENNLVNFSAYSGSSGVLCTPWKDFGVHYISGYGATNGAGVMAEVISPAGCSDSSCRYRTGAITIRKECK